MSSLPTNKFDVSNRVFGLLFIFLIGLLGFWSLRIFEIWSTANGTYPAHEITVDATGMSYVTPDVAKIQIGVHTQAKTSVDAVTQNTTKINDIMKALTALSIKKDEIKTVNYYLNPNYQYTPDKGQVQDGYVLDQTLEITVRDFQKIGDVIASTSSSGANMIGGINFTIENRETAKVEARKIAIKNAEIKAQQLADQTGLKLDRITNYSEYDSGGGPIGMGMSAAPAAMDFKVATPPTIEPGQQQINLTVNLTYKIK